MLFFFSCQSESKKPASQEELKPSELVVDSFRSKRIISYISQPANIQFFLKDDKGKYFNNHGNLKKHLDIKNQQLKFAMNGGMYLEDASPQGLYFENGKLIKKLNTKKSTYGNFYMQPNGIFYITKDDKAFVVTTSSFKQTEEIKYATQSGPMLLIKGKMHPKFTEGSKHLHIRNGVGILPNGGLLFAMSKDSINFYEFASYFAEQGCKNALYLDGAISKMYLPEKGIEQTKGRFGVIVAEVEKN